MEPRFSHLLGKFRKYHNTQHSLLKILEKWKFILDEGCNIGVTFMDISKKFYALNHEILLAKLNVYRFSENAIVYIKKSLF